MCACFALGGLRSSAMTAFGPGSRIAISGLRLAGCAAQLRAIANTACYPEPEQGYARSLGVTATGQYTLVGMGLVIARMRAGPVDGRQASPSSAPARPSNWVPAQSDPS